MFASMARLTSLQQLQLTSYLAVAWGMGDDTFSCITALGQLSQLTELNLGGYWTEGRAEASRRSVQQLLAQPLALRVLQLGVITDLPVLNMGQLTQLTKLIVRSQLAEGLVLPQQLQHLQLFRRISSSQLAALLPLQQLQRVDLHIGFSEGEELRRLAAKTALQHLKLRYDDAAAAAGTAGVWAQLPQLQVLEANWDTHTAPTRQQSSAILSGLSAATSLTSLLFQAVYTLEAVEPDEDVDDDDAEVLGVEAVAACASLAALTGLQDLHIPEGSVLPTDDALALTALTNLTRLVLHDDADGVTDMTASALACSLKQLRVLDLSSKHPGNSRRLGSMVCLAAIGHLSQLTSLILGGAQGLTRQGFMLLLPAPRLRTVVLKFNEEVTQNWAKAQFAAASQRPQQGRSRVVVS
jgi:hypothetical protein